MAPQSIYAPDLALDLDLLVTTTAKKEDDVYRDAVADWPVNVDVVVREPGQRIGDWIAWGVCAAHQVLRGDGDTEGGEDCDDYSNLWRGALTTAEC